jgi:hypothetical protein
LLIIGATMASARKPDLLGPIYSWFTEGSDAPAMYEAKALLDELV